MNNLLSLVQLTVPGSLSRHDTKMNKFLKSIIKDLKDHNIDYAWFDTISGWGNLNQDWVEFETEINTSWGWCLPSWLSDKQKNRWLKLLNSGKVIMMIHYIEELHNGKKKYIPHC